MNPVEAAAELYGDDLLKMDGFDDCVAGVILGYGRPPTLCYDRGRVLQRLMADGMSEEEAEEFWSFNQVGAYVGENTPVFLHSIDDIKEWV